MAAPLRLALASVALLLGCKQPGPSEVQERSAVHDHEPTAAPAQPVTPAPAKQRPPPSPMTKPRLEVARHEVTGATLEREREQLAALLATPCPKLTLLPEDEYLSARLREPDEFVSLRVWSQDDHLLMSWSSLDATGMYEFRVSYRYELYDARACTARLIESVWRGRLVTEHGAARPLERYPNDHVLASLLGEWADCSDPRHGFACMYLGVHQRCGTGDVDAHPAAGRDWDLLAITQNPSPWVTGPRADQVETFWPQAEFWARRNRPIPTRGEEYDGPPGLAIGNSIATPRPAQLVRKVGRYRLYEAVLPIKNNGLALLMRDDMQERHRWIGHTRECLLAEEVEWLMAGEHLVVGWGHHSGAGPQPDGLNGLFVVDLETGIIHLLRTAELAAKWDGPGDFWWLPEPEPEQDESGEQDSERWFHVEDRTLVFDGGLRISIDDLRQYIDANR